MNSPNKLGSKINDLSKFININQLLRQSFSIDNIASYYKANRLTYWLLMSRAGAVHLSFKGDYFGPVKFINEQLGDTSKQVLELAAGKGFNTSYLANNNPGKFFTATDIKGGQFKPRGLRRRKNVRALYADFHDLTEFKEGSFDAVFILEALCYARSQRQVLKEVRRVLKKGGKFIIIQDSLTKPLASLTPDEKKAFLLLHKGVMANHKERTHDELISNLKLAGFKTVKCFDETSAIKPQLKKFESQTSFFMRHRILTKLLTKTLPARMTDNLASAYLLPALFDEQLLRYEIVVAA